MSWRARMLHPEFMGIKNKLTLDALEEIIPMPDFELVDVSPSNNQSRLLWFIAWLDLAYQEGLLSLQEVAGLLTVIESNL